MAAVRAAGVPVREFELCGSVRDKMGALIRLRRAIRTSNADIIHAWMYHSALLAFLFARNRRRVLIAIHHTNPFDAGLPWTTRAIAFGCSLASRLSGAVVYVAGTARVMHERIGYSKRRGLIVNVGVDESTMVPASPNARSQSRRRFGLPQTAMVVVHVARYHRNKDQPTLIDAFGRALNKVPGMRLLLVGEGLDPTNKELRSLIEFHGVQDNVELIGELDSPLEAFHSADIFCLSSLTEAFPVSLVEALLCGLVPVVTDVGECRTIADGTGFVVQPNSAQSLADALVKAAASARSRSSESIRARGLEFGLSRMCDEYQDVYSKMIARAGSSA
jgi:glycosyltransferase involved in cell wall biosynthesis